MSGDSLTATSAYSAPQAESEAEEALLMFHIRASSSTTKGVRSTPSLPQSLLCRLTMFPFAGDFTAQVPLLAA